MNRYDNQLSGLWFPRGGSNRHYAIGEWAIGGVDGTVSIRSLIDHINLTGANAVDVPIESIATKGDVIVNSTRYQLADISYPLIISRMENPQGLEYRLIDGRHRLHKLRNEGHSSAACYIIDPTVVINNFQRILQNRRTPWHH